MLVKQIVGMSILCFVLVLQLMQYVFADDKAYYDRVSLTVDASTEVDNDTLISTLSIQREGSELATLSQEVNQSVSQAVAQSKKQPDVIVKTLAYQTHPVYQKQRLTGWRVKQSIQLKSENIKAMSQLIGDLQSLLALESMSYTVSRAQRLTTEEKLITEAIASFNKRALQITEQLGRKTYRLVSMDVRTNTPPFRPMHIGARPMMEAARAAPVIEPGKQSLTVSVSGIIELVVN